MMHYYEHNIGKYRSDTAHLSLLEHGIYRQLIDTYYLSEQPLIKDVDKLMRSHSVRTADEVQAFKNVLADFFEETKNGFIHKGCQKVLEQIYAKSEKARQSANARWSKKNSELDANALRTDSDGNANGMLPNNLLPNTKPKTIVRTSSARFDDFWSAWPKTGRKVAKAACMKKWKSKNLDAIADKIIEHVNAMKLTKSWLDGFEPAPLTYLNQERWIDDVVKGNTQILAKPWILSGKQIEEKGAEAGIAIDPNRPWTDFRDKVFHHYKVTPEQVRQAKIDFPN
jgi:uncharacterized protein YdaU (DUF1376 family)